MSSVYMRLQRLSQRLIFSLVRLYRTTLVTTDSNFDFTTVECTDILKGRGQKKGHIQRVLAPKRAL